MALTFTQLLAAVLIGWILVELWVRAIDNFTFNCLGLDRNSPMQTFLIALILTGLFIGYVMMIGDDEDTAKSAVSQLQILPVIGASVDIVNNGGMFTAGTKKPPPERDD